MNDVRKSLLEASRSVITSFDWSRCLQLLRLKLVARAKDLPWVDRRRDEAWMLTAFLMFPVPRCANEETKLFSRPNYNSDDGVELCCQHALLQSSVR